MLDYRHLINMTDDKGMLQFSLKSSPDTNSGYTLDDNARALIVSINMENGFDLSLRYIAFLSAAVQTNSWSNFYINNQFSSHFDSEDSVGRALLAGSLAAQSSWPQIQNSGRQLLLNNLDRCRSFKHPRAIAYTIVALTKYEHHSHYYDLIITLADKLSYLYNNTHQPDWYWFENHITYCNAIIPQAMFCAYQTSGFKKYLEIGLDSFNFLGDLLFKTGYLNIVGNNGWYQHGLKCPLFDQQPIDACSVAFAAQEAYYTTGKMEYLQWFQLAHQWYYGKNIHQLSLYDPVTGGCYDALTPAGLNYNQGAEAVLSLLLCGQLITITGGQKHNINSHLKSFPLSEAAEFSGKSHYKSLSASQYYSG